MLAACTPQEERFVWEKVEFPALTENHAALALSAFQASCAREKIESLQIFDKDVPLEVWARLCDAAAGANADTAQHFFNEYFDLYSVRTTMQDTGLLTGYYVPLLQGSVEAQEGYSVPVYAKPPEALRTRHSRAEIEAGALHEQGLEVLYLADAVDAFFLHIQGSGKVVLPDGDIRLLRYAGKNEFPYTAIGRQFIEDGVVAKEDMSLVWLKDWLRANPDEAAKVMQRNASYIYFELVESADAIIGSEGSVLTPMHSIAVDPSYISYGLPLMVQATLPDGEALHHIVVAQDTGSAIRGRLRADLFTGSGAQAERLAGALKADTIFYALLPKEMQP